MESAYRTISITFICNKFEYYYSKTRPTNNSGPAPFLAREIACWWGIRQGHPINDSIGLSMDPSTFTPFLFFSFLFFSLHAWIYLFHKFLFNFFFNGEPFSYRLFIFSRKQRTSHVEKLSHSLIVFLTSEKTGIKYLTWC